VTALLSVGQDLRPSPGGRTHLGMAFFFLGLAVYGSLIPLEYKFVSLGETLVRWHQVHRLNIAIEGRSDFVAGILLFIPLGCLFVATSRMGLFRQAPVTA
jgi:hypothetical protein